MERIYTQLNLAGFPETRPRIEAYLESVAHYKKNEHVFTEETIGTVDRHWGELVRRWAYSRPD